MTTPNITPIADRILIKMHPVKEQVIGAIYAPQGGLIDIESGSLRLGLEESIEGTVLRLGTGKKDAKGRPVPFDVAVGDEVMINKGAGQWVEKHSENAGYKLVPEDEIILVKGAV